MTEGQPQGGERMMGAAPEWIGAVFEQGNRKGQVTDIYSRTVPYEILVPVYDVKEKEEREKWIFENMRVFLDGTVASPERKWKDAVDNWLSELRFAANRVHLDRKELRETEADLKAIMAVCSSARAMEVSTGSATTYVECVTLTGRGGNLALQDTWSDFLLHDDPDKLKRVVGFSKDNAGGNIDRFPLIRHYYDRLVAEAGITLKDDRISKEDRISIVDINTNVALRSNLVKCLTGEDGRRGLNDYISDFMMKEKDGKKEESDEFKAQWGSDSQRWTAAKIATDAFLVNLYTQWEYKIHKEGVDEQGEKVMYKPVPTWGGDPFRAVLEPSFLPRRIKGMYQGKDSVLLDLVDLAFRPDDLEGDPAVSAEVKQEINKKLLKASATSHLKAYGRYSDALWEFFGSSRGMGIPRWDKKIMGEGLPSVVENLDQVYGGMETKEIPNLGKQILGLMTMRIIHCKALAVAMESSRPGFTAKMGILFGEEKTRPFFEVRQFLYGPNIDAKDGFFEDLAGARVRLIFDKSSLFYRDIHAKWRETWEILASSDQTPEGRKTSKALNIAGFAIDVLTAISQTKKRG